MLALASYPQYSASEKAHSVIAPSLVA